MKTIKNAFVKFWSDYNDMCIKPQCNWLKLHWKGYIVTIVASGIGGYAVGKAIDTIADKKREKEYEKIRKEYENKE